MSLDSFLYLVIVAHPLSMVFSIFLGYGKGAAELLKGFTAVVYAMSARGWFAKCWKTDDEVVFRPVAASLLEKFKMIHIPSGPNVHEHVVERRVGIIKEKVRSLMMSLPYKVPLRWVPHCVEFVVSRMNMMPTTTRADGTTPREGFDGRLLNFQDLRATFGDYVHVTVALNAGEPGKNDVRVPRTVPGIVLKQLTADRTGTFVVWSMETQREIHATQFTIVPLSKEIISKINALTEDKSGPVGRIPTDGEVPEGADAPQTQVVQDRVVQVIAPGPHPDFPMPAPAMSPITPVVPEPPIEVREQLP
jgi:hypothetical protein